ncbi:MAG: flagellar hook basal-body protein [Longimicrobiales bacterium]
MSGPDSLRAAGHALVYWHQRQEVNAHNLANVETAGFRGRRVFAEMLAGGLPQLGTAVDPRSGDLRQTGSPLDLALVGEGHFVVQGDTGGEQLVRSGSFTMDESGRVVDAHGRSLLGEGGPLLLPPGPVEIDARGRITVAGEEVGRLRVVREAAGATELPATDPVAEDGGGTSAARTPAAVASGETLGEEDVRVRQGYLEGSNVSALDALIEMTTIQRSFEAVQNSVRALDSVMETVANRVGRVG